MPEAVMVLVWMLVVLAIFSIVYFTLKQLPLPPPAKAIGYAITGIVCLILLLYFVGLWPGTHLHRW